MRINCDAHVGAQMVPEFDTAIFKTGKVGAIEGPIKTQFGYHLYACPDHTHARRVRPWPTLPRSAWHGVHCLPFPALHDMHATHTNRTHAHRTAPHRTAFAGSSSPSAATRRPRCDPSDIGGAFFTWPLDHITGPCIKKKDRTKYGPFDLFKFVCGPRESCTNTGVLANEQGRRTAHFGNRLPTLTRFCDHWAPEARH